MKDGLMVRTTKEDYQIPIIESGTDFVSLADIKIEHPTFSYVTQLPEPVNFWMNENGTDKTVLVSFA